MGPSKMKKIHDVLDFDLQLGTQSEQIYHNDRDKVGKYSK